MLPADNNAADTLRPPPSSTLREELAMLAVADRLSAVRLPTFPVIVRCETEEQRALLIDYLTAMGFDIEER
jgi:hypothetical protein